MDIWTLTFLVFTGAATWFVLRRWPQAPSTSGRSTHWGLAPLLAGIALWLSTVFTFGAALLLAPIGVVLTLVSARRVSPPRGFAFWCGAMLNSWLGIYLLITLGIVLYDNLVG
jgi:hypothetical protein